MQDRKEDKIEKFGQRVYKKVNFQPCINKRSSSIARREGYARPWAERPKKSAAQSTLGNTGTLFSSLFMAETFKGTKRRAVSPTVQFRPNLTLRLDNKKNKMTDSINTMQFNETVNADLDMSGTQTYSEAAGL